MLTLFVALGSAPALADDVPTDPGTSTTETPPTDPATPESPDTTGATDAPPPPSGSAADVPSDAPDLSAPKAPAPKSRPAATGTSTDAGAKTFSSALAAALVSLCDPQNAPVNTPGGFEIDGNTCVDDSATPLKDWDTYGEHKFDGAKDATAYKQGDAENTDPAGWHTGGSSQGKDDITDAWSYTNVVGGNVWTYFAVNRVADNGTTTYDVELNKNANSSDDPSRPSRSIGDLLLQFSVNGTGPLKFDKAYSWTALASFNNPGCFQTVGINFGWCPLNTVAPPAFFSQVSDDGLFAEGAINLSALAGANGSSCSGNFGEMNIRTISSEQNTASLQDFVDPFDVAIPSSCGSIVINKQDLSGNAVGGAHFTISPDPTPGSNGAGPITLVDGGAGDADNTANGVITINPAEADTYTVTETQAPAGYLLPNPASQTLTLAPGAGNTATFTFQDPKQWQALTATKTANPTYTASYAWTFEKQIAATANGPWSTSTTSADPLVKNVPASGNPTNGSLFYRLLTSENGRTTSNYQVSGNISVTNPNAGAVTADLSDTLPGASCLVGGSATKTVAVPGNATTPYAYVCTFAGTPSAGELSGTNTALVTWDRSDYPQSQADVNAAGSYNTSPTANYAFGAETTAINKTVTVTDDQHVFPGGLTYTYGVGGPSHTSDVYSQSLSAVPGSCSSVFANTATWTGNGNAATAGDDAVLGTDSAYGRICAAADLTITRMDARGFTRTYPWAIEKATTTPKVTVVNGQASATYDVTVTAGEGVDTGWTMTGTITVHNPNNFEAVSVTGVPVTYDGINCSVSGSFPVSIAASGSQAFTYTCNFASKPSYTGTVKATVNWNQAAASTPNGSATDDLNITEANWTKTLVNNQITVHDDHASGADDVIATLTWADVYALPNHQKVIHYTTPLTGLPDGGTCGTKVNTVWIVGDGGAHLDDQNTANNSASVQVCNPIGLSVTKTAQGDFTRTYNWVIEKFINGDQTSQTVNLDSYQHTFDYKVKVTPGSAVDSGWTVSGVITVKNDNISDDIDPIQLTGVSDLPAIGSTGSCTYQAPGIFPIAVDSGDSIQVGYQCTFANQPTKPYGGTNTATATWGQNGSASTPATPVTWKSPTEVDKSIEVYDNKVSQGANPVHLGTATWNDQGTPTVFDYQLTLSVPETTAGSCGAPFVNTAWLGGDGIKPTDRQDSTSATICVNPGTWTVAKANVDGDGPIPVDSDVTYRLTAHKTGGVNPKNVVVKDDLSDLVDHIDGPPQFDVPAGTTVDYNTTTHVLTWTIAELGGTDRTLDFTVHVSDDAYGVDLPNLVTSPGSTNCPDAETAAGVDACTTDNDTPSFTLKKASDADAVVLPPYLGAPGTTITYTLTVHNDSDAPINPTTLPNAHVTDDLSDVLDNASFVPGSIAPAGQAELSGTTLTWTLPVIPAGGNASLSYQVIVKAGEWNEELTNEVTPGPGGDCVEAADCTTTSVTPETTQISVKKVDAETGDPLAGAEFDLLKGDTVIDSATSGADGVAVFGVKLLPGQYTVKETKAPAGYSLPINGQATQVITIDSPDDEEGNFVSGGVMAPILFEDPANGTLALVGKQHQERDPATNEWVAGDGAVEFGDEIHYVIDVTAEGPKLQHDVTVTDYLPGSGANPADTTSTGKGVYVSNSGVCTGDFTCTVTVDEATGKITWVLNTAGQPAGTVKGDATGTVEFTIRMQDLPLEPVYDDQGIFQVDLWNQAYLDSAQFNPETDKVEPAAQQKSNEVTDTAKAIEPAPEPEPEDFCPDVPGVQPQGTDCGGEDALPPTGGPDSWLLYLGLALALGGSAVVASDRRHRRRS